MLEKEENLFFPGPAFGELNTLRRNRLYLNHMRTEIIRLSRFSKPHSFVFSIPHGTQIHALLWKEIEQREPQRVLQFLLPLDSVAGLVMLAWLPPKEAEQMLAAHLADPVFIQKWNGSREKLDRSLALCRQNGYSALPYEAPGTLRIAVPVFGVPIKKADAAVKVRGNGIVGIDILKDRDIVLIFLFERIERRLDGEVARSDSRRARL